MKKLIALILVLVMSLSFFACAPSCNPGGNTDAPGGTNSDVPQGGSGDSGGSGGGTGDNGGSGGSGDNGGSDGGTGSTTSYSVTYKNSDGTVLLVDSVRHGDVAREPEVPETSGISLVGWFLDFEGKIPYDFKTAVTKDTVLFAKWQGGAAADTESIEKTDLADHRILAMVFDAANKRVTVGVVLTEPCELTLNFYGEESYFGDDPKCIEELSVTQSLTDERGYGTAYAAIPIEGELPDSFVIEGVLKSADGTELDRTRNIKETKRYARFDATAAEDFGKSDKVLIFSDDKKTNFGVLADDVKMITAESVTEFTVTNSEDVLYLIKSPSEKIAVGDKIYVKNGEHELLFKVKSVKEDGDGYSVLPVRADGETGYSLSEFYKFLKVNMSLEDDKPTPTPLAADSADPSVKVMKIEPAPFTFVLDDNVVVEGKVLGGHLRLDCSFVWAPSIFGEDYFECSFDAGAQYDVELSLTASVGSDGEEADGREVKQLMKIIAPMFAGFNPKIEFSALFSYELSGTVSAVLPIYANGSFKYSTEEGFKANAASAYIDVSDDDEDWLSCSGEATLTFGPVVSFGIDFLLGMAEAEISAAGGIRLTGSTEFPELAEGCDMKHECFLCIDGHVDFFFEVSASFAVHLTSAINWEPLGIKLYSAEVKDIFIFHVSKEAESAPFKFGMGLCDNYLIKYPIHMNCYGETVKSCTKPTSGSVDGVHFVQTEGQPDGRHFHECDDIIVQIYDADTGKLIASTSRYGNSGDGEDDYIREVEISAKVKNIYVVATIACSYYDCPVYEYHGETVITSSTQRSYTEHRIVYVMEGYAWFYRNEDGKVYVHCGFEQHFVDSEGINTFIGWSPDQDLFFDEEYNQMPSEA